MNNHDHDNHNKHHCDHTHVPIDSMTAKEIDRSISDYEFNEGVISLRIWDEFNLSIAKRILQMNFFVTGLREEDGNKLFVLSAIDEVKTQFAIVDEELHVYEQFNNISEVYEFIDSEKIHAISKKQFN